MLKCVTRIEIVAWADDDNIFLQTLPCMRLYFTCPSNKCFRNCRQAVYCGPQPDQGSCRSLAPVQWQLSSHTARRHIHHRQFRLGGAEEPVQTGGCGCCRALHAGELTIKMRQTHFSQISTDRDVMSPNTSDEITYRFFCNHISANVENCTLAFELKACDPSAVLHWLVCPSCFQRWLSRTDEDNHS